MHPRHAHVTPDPADLPGLRGLSAYSRRLLLERGRDLRIPAGWSPVHQSEPADKAYLILEGTLRVMDGDRAVASVGVGELAGEMGLVDHRLRNARLTATEPVRVLAWPRDDFQALRRELPEFDALVEQVTRDRHEENDAS